MTLMFDALKRAIGDEAEKFNPNHDNTSRNLSKIKSSKGISKDEFVRKMNVQACFKTRRVGRINHDYDLHPLSDLKMSSIKGFSIAYVDLPKVLNYGVEFSQLDDLGIVMGDRVYFSVEAISEVKKLLSDGFVSFIYLNDSANGIVHVMLREE